MPISYIYNGEPMTGTANDDFFIAFQGSTGTSNNTVNANNGDDLVIGDSSDTWIPGQVFLNGAIASAFNLEGTMGPWTTAENQMFGDWTIPHTTAMVEATIGQSEFFRIAIGAGQQITIDIDFASNTAIGNPRDLVVELQDSLGNVIVIGDDSLITQGGQGSAPSAPGSASSNDPYLTYTVASGGIYYINVRPYGSGPGATFTENNIFVMNVSVTGHAVAAANPVQGADIINGGFGDDALFGQGGGDIINGDAGDDFIDSGSGGDVVHGGEGNDTLHGGDGTEENIHGDNGNDKLISGGEGHYYGDAGDDIIYAGITTGVNEVLDGGADIDTLDTTTWTGGYTINLVTGATNFGESFINFENIVTGDGADGITGTAGANIITTRGGTDTVNAGAGNDIVAGGADGDTLDGGTDFDILSYRTSSGAVTINLIFNTVSGGHAAGDFISNFEGVWGSVLGDTLTADAGDNELRGFEGNDVLSSGAGNDILDGGLNNDTMTGGLGNDIYYVDSLGDIVIELAGEGTDTMAVGFDYVLANGSTIEWLATIAPNATTGIDLTGNSSVNSLTGDEGDNVLDGGGGADAMAGHGGNDWYYIDNAADTITGEGVGQGAADRLYTSVSYILSGGAQIETLAPTNLAGTGALNITGNGYDQVIYGNDGVNVLSGLAGIDTLFGGAGNDTLDGGAGDDTLDGGTGQDSMTGGTGDDTYKVDHTADTVTELPGQGTDTVLAAFTYSINASPDVENLGTINSGALTAINLTGNAAGNILTGNAGSNILDGKGGADTMSGGNGNDWYYIDNAGDVIVNESGGYGTNDRIFTAVSYVLAAGIQIESLAPTDLLGTGALDITGNEFVQVIYGNAGDNVLDGKGGADTMVGGAGNDTYYVDHVNDAIFSEGAGKGIVDHVISSVSYTLAPSVQVELLTLIDPAATTALNLTGNELGQTIYGNAGDNILNGKGGTDTLNGGAGNDWYYVDNLTDTIFGEGAGLGNDRVVAASNYVLGAGLQIETMTTANPAGTTAINLTGNELVQSIYGNDGNNILDGGAGADSLYGGGGNDWYYVDNAADVIGTEGVGKGTDRVYASVNYTLGAGQEIETVLTTLNGGLDPLSLTGNEFANTIYGNAGNNVIDGKGGSDTLQGLGGQDIYAFTTALGAGNIDTITGFSVANNTIHLENAVFTGLVAGALAAGAFNTGAAATQADDRIIYNSATGALMFDGDGAGVAAAAVQFATLATGLALTAADFFVI